MLEIHYGGQLQNMLKILHGPGIDFLGTTYTLQRKKLTDDQLQVLQSSFSACELKKSCKN